MPIDKSKILKSAEKFVATGKIAQAIDEYEKILKENPKDWNLMIQIGDLMLKVNRTSDAIENFQIVADHYFTDGFFLKAIAIYKRINKLDPTLTEICIKLAELYLKQGLTMDAKSQLQLVAQSYLNKNQNKEAIQTLQKLIEIEPDNLRTRNDLAKAYKNEGMIPEAIQEYLEISEHLLRKNLAKENVAVLETASKLDPKNLEVLRKLLTAYTELKEPAKGIAHLEEALRSDPTNSEILALMAETYATRKEFSKAHQAVDQAIGSATRKEDLWELKGDLYLLSGDLGEAFSQYCNVIEKEVEAKDLDRAVPLMQKIVERDTNFDAAWQRLVELYALLRQHANLESAYSSLADAYISKQKYADAAKAVEKLIELDPDDGQHQEKLRFVRSFLDQTKPDTKVPVKEYEVEEVPGSINTGDFGISLSAETISGVPHFETEPAKPQPRTVSQPIATKAPAAPAAAKVDLEKEFVSEHLIEAEVFNKYGLIDKAIEQLQRILAKYPNSVPARQKLKEIYLEKGERDRAVQECITMSRIFRKQGDADQAEDLLSEARQINPNHPGLERAYREAPISANAASAPSTATEPKQPLYANAPQTPTAERPQMKRPSLTGVPAIETPAKSVSKSMRTAADKQVGASAQASKDVLSSLRLPKEPAPLSSAKIAVPKSGAKQGKDSSSSLKKTDLLGEIEKFAQSIKTQSGTFRLRQPSPPSPPKPELPPPVPASVEPDEIEIEIDEIDAQVRSEETALPQSAFEEVEFFYNQGFLSDAVKLLNELKTKHPDDPGIRSRLEKIETAQAARSTVVPEPSTEEISIEIDEDFQTPFAPVAQVEADEVGALEAETAGDAKAGESASISAVADAALPEIEIDLGLDVSEQSVEHPAVSQSAGIAADVSQPEAQEQASQLQDEQLLEFGELEDTGSLREAAAEAGSKINEEATFDLDLEQSLNDAVDAVFQTPEEDAAPRKEEEEVPTKAAVKEELFEEEDDFFDLAAELEEGLLNVQSAVQDDRPPDGQNYSLEEILTDFKKGVEKQLSAEDYDTRYNLGIAYKEMGLVDEAIAEFQVASKDPKRFLECCSMLGLCFVEKGMWKLAVKWYQRGLDSPGYSEDEYQGLRFDLAQAFESTGEQDKALEVYQEVYGINANYRNVSKKIRELQGLLKKKH